MVFLVIRTWYPMHIQPAVTEVYQKNLQDFPESGSPSTLVAHTYNSSERGWENLVIRSVSAEKLADAMVRATQALMNYAPIEDYRFTMEVWGDPSEITAQ